MNRATECSKCGSKDLYFHYHDKGEGRYGNPCYFEDWCDREHLDRGCRQCSYEWCEEVNAENSLQQRGEPNGKE